MKPIIHADNSVKKWGGKPEDYQAIHDFFDATKAHFADMRHRVILHNTFGIFLAERVFGHAIVNSDGVRVSVRDIAEEHVMEDLGCIPSLQDYLQHMPMLDWLGGKAPGLFDELLEAATPAIEPPAAPVTTGMVFDGVSKHRLRPNMGPSSRSDRRVD